MSEENSSVGRPRIYATSSEKVSAFRSRQLSEGYVRKEILVDAKTWEAVSQLAREHKVSASDAGAGLLEYGLAQFNSLTSGSTVEKGEFPDKLELSSQFSLSQSIASAQMLSASAVAPVSALRSLGNQTETTTSSESDRIRDFFNKRKKAQNNDI